MKTQSIRIRVEPALKRSFEAAARHNHQTLSQFLVQAGIAAVDATRAKGGKLKPAPEPKDERGKHRGRKAVAS